MGTKNAPNKVNHFFLISYEIKLGAMQLSLNSMYPIESVLSHLVSSQLVWPSISAVTLTSRWAGGRAGGSLEKPAT